MLAGFVEFVAEVFAGAAGDGEGDADFNRWVEGAEPEREPSGGVGAGQGLVLIIEAGLALFVRIAFFDFEVFAVDWAVGRAGALAGPVRIATAASVGIASAAAGHRD